MSDIISRFHKEIAPQIQQEFGLKNQLALPKIEKIVINAGVADALSTKDVIEKVRDQLTTIAGQKAKITKARESISNFKLKKGDAIGVMVTLRGKKAWYFLEKLVAVVTPRIRDFRGISDNKFDTRGNYTLGIGEQILFPEIDYAKIDKVRGLAVTIVIRNSNVEKSKKLLELLGLPFKLERKN